jgi:hypothetical protein
VTAAAAAAAAVAEAATATTASRIVPPLSGDDSITGGLFQLACSHRSGGDRCRSLAES